MQVAFDLYEPVLQSVLLEHGGPTPLSKTTVQGLNRFHRHVVGKTARTTMLLSGRTEVCLTELKKQIEERVTATNSRFHLVSLRLCLMGAPFLETKWTILTDNPHSGGDDDLLINTEEEKEPASLTRVLTSFLSSKLDQARKTWRQSGLRQRLVVANERKTIMDYHLVFPKELETKLHQELNLPSRNEDQLRLVLKFIRSFQGGKTPVQLTLQAASRFDPALARQIVDISVKGLREVDTEDVQSVLVFVRKQEVWDDPIDKMDLVNGVLTFSMRVRMF